MCNNKILNNISITNLIWFAILSFSINLSYAQENDNKLQDSDRAVVRNVESEFRKLLSDSLSDLESIASDINNKALSKEINSLASPDELTHTVLEENGEVTLDTGLVVPDPNQPNLHFSWKLIISFGIIIFVAAL